MGRLVAFETEWLDSTCLDKLGKAKLAIGAWYLYRQARASKMRAWIAADAARPSPRPYARVKQFLKAELAQGRWPPGRS